MVPPRISRQIALETLIRPNKVLVLYGARQVGKTTLVRRYLESASPRKGGIQVQTGDDVPFGNMLSQCDLHLLKATIPPDSLLFIDEAQRIPHVGRALKLLVDNIPGLEVIVTGSSSFELLQSTGEALTGRKTLVTMYPISVQEALSVISPLDLTRNLPDFLRFGMYPEVLSTKIPRQKEEIVRELTGSYLLKDILDFDKIKDSKKIFDVLRLLAFQVGNEVSTSELANTVGVDKNTVARYLDLLEKSFVLYRLDGFSRNLRKEVSKMSKYYFYDLGIRNALISNFNDLSLRNDLGQLWENFLVMERIKYLAYSKEPRNFYFWRTYDRKEIDWIEEGDGALKAYEFKWTNQGVKAPKDWLEAYPEAYFEVINQTNWKEFVMTSSYPP